MAHLVFCAICHHFFFFSSPCLRLFLSFFPLIAAYIKLCKCMICMFIYLLLFAFFYLSNSFFCFHYILFSRTQARVISRTSLNGAPSLARLLFSCPLLLSAMFLLLLLLLLWFASSFIQNNFYASDFSLFPNRCYIVITVELVCDRALCRSLVSSAW